MDDVDVIILGGGPAGCAAAIELARRGGVSVTVLERARHARHHIGEMLPPTTRSVLTELGAWDAFVNDQHIETPGIVSTWDNSVAFEFDFLFSPWGNGWLLDRTKFDLMWVKLVTDLGVRVLRGLSPVSVKRIGEIWELTCRGEATSFRCRFLIDATGRSSWLAHRQGAVRQTVDNLIACIGYAEQVAPGDHRLFLEAVSNGWWYSARLPGARAVAAFMMDADLTNLHRQCSRNDWLAAIRDAPLASRVFDSATLTDVFATSAKTSRLNRCYGSGWVAVGDSAMSFDPLSAQGITKGLESGRNAGEAVRQLLLKNDTGSLTQYALQLESQYRDYLLNRSLYYSRAGGRWNLPFWTRRQNPNVLPQSNAIRKGQP